MFNRAGFNQIKYNRPTTAEVFASMQAAGIGGFAVSVIKETMAEGVFQGKGTAGVTVSRITFAKMLAEGVGGIFIPLGKSRIFSAKWQGIGKIQIDNESYTIEIMKYYGDLAPGDRIIINTEKFTVIKNNQNDLENFDGSFINLKEGINELVFEDGETSRTILLRVEHKDRFI